MAAPPSNPNPLELQDRVILVTGASRGIGHAVASACAAAGARVIAAGRDVPALESLAEALTDEGHPEPVLLPLNLEAATADDYASVAEHIDAQFGRLDGLALIAAALGELAPLNSCDAVLWARVFQVNVHSALLMTQALWPLLRASEDGTLLVTLSEEAFAAKAHWSAYGASKWALRGMFEMWSAETRNDNKIRVHAIVPHPVHTRLRMNAYPGADPEGLHPPESMAATYLEVLRGSAGLEPGSVTRSKSARGR